MSDLSIKEIKARVIFNSRGVETLEVNIRVNEHWGRCSYPEGASVGKFEAKPFAKGKLDESLKVLKEIETKLLGFDALDYKGINILLRELDGTSDYSRIGGAIPFCVTFAMLDASSKNLQEPLFRLINKKESYLCPFPLGNILGGGKHAGGKSPDIQEFLVCPVGAKSFREALKANFKVHQTLGEILLKFLPDFTKGKGDEGAWAPKMGNQEALEKVKEAINRVMDEVGFEIKLGLDVASSTLWDPNKGVYVYEREGIKRNKEEQRNYLRSIIEKYDLFYIEDPFQEEDFESTAKLTEEFKSLFITGDDLFASNPVRLEYASRIKAGNSAILKVNQVGGLGDAWGFIEKAKSLNYSLITSHRSGDVPEGHISHLALASESKMLKAGVLGGERIAKLNELLRLSEDYNLRMVNL
ncbi:MAG: enolase [Nitrososphaerales archaeon]